MKEKWNERSETKKITKEKTRKEEKYAERTMLVWNEKNIKRVFRRRKPSVDGTIRNRKVDGKHDTMKKKCTPFSLEIWIDPFQLLVNRSSKKKRLN